MSLVKRVGHRGGERAGIALVAVGADVGEDNAGGVGGFDRLGLPNQLVESLDAAVQMVRAVVRGQLVFDAVEGELSLGDAIGEAADGRTEAGMALEVVGQRIERERDVGQLAVAVGRFDGGDRGARRS